MNIHTKKRTSVREKIIFLAADADVRFPARQRRQRNGVVSGGDFFSEAKDEMQTLVKRQERIGELRRRQKRKEGQISVASSTELDMGVVRKQLLAPSLSFDLRMKDDKSDEEDSVLKGSGLEVMMPGDAQKTNFRDVLRHQLLKSVSRRRAERLSDDKQELPKSLDIAAPRLKRLRRMIKRIDEEGMDTSDIQHTVGGEESDDDDEHEAGS